MKKEENEKEEAFRFKCQKTLKTVLYQKKIMTLIILLLLLVIGIFVFNKFMTVKKNKIRDLIVPVKVATVIEKPIEINFHSFGSVKAYSSVEIKSRVSGPVVKEAIEEGARVKTGDLLFVIDPRPFQAQVQRSEANLARDKAQLEKAQFDYENYSKLVTTGAVSKEQFQAVRSNKSMVEATLKGDEADLETAKLQLGYTQLLSPIDGITGDFLTNLGTVVKADETVLVVINQTQPIYVHFNLPASKLQEVKEAMNENSVIVRVGLPKTKKWIEEGKIVFIDNELDPTTGTILIKAEFNNKEEFLVSGEYVSIELVLKTLPNAKVIPTEAIQKDNENNTYVYIVENGKAQRRNITATSFSETESVVERGLDVGQKVVTDGIFQLVPGSEVKIES